MPTVPANSKGWCELRPKLPAKFTWQSDCPFCCPNSMGQATSYRTHSGAAVLILLLIASAASAAPKKEKKAGSSDQPQVLELMWPEPPLTPRIKVVNVLASELDLGRKMTFRESLLKFTTGERPQIAKIYQPRDIVVAESGRIYASDFGLQVVFVFDREKRKVTTIPAERPFGLALDDAENLYVAEQEARQIRVIDAGGQTVRTIKHDSLVRPADVAIDPSRKRLYVADPSRKSSEDHSVKVFDLEGKFIRKIGVSKGTCTGCMYFPTYVAVDKDGNVYVTSTLKAQVDVFDANGKFLKAIGGRGSNFGMFDKPKGVSLDSFGNIYVVDSGWSNVQIFNQKGEVLLFFGGRGTYPGLLANPTGIAVDKDNRIYVADYLNYRVVVYQLVNTKAEDSYVTLPDVAAAPRNDPPKTGAQSSVNPPVTQAQK